MAIKHATMFAFIMVETINGIASLKREPFKSVQPLTVCKKVASFF